MRTWQMPHVLSTLHTYFYIGADAALPNVQAGSFQTALATQGCQQEHAHGLLTVSTTQAEKLASAVLRALMVSVSQRAVVPSEVLNSW